jgi:hypothetical protein
MRKILLLLWMTSPALSLFAQGPNPDRLESGYNDTLWHYVKKHDSKHHWNTLKDYNITLTGTVCTPPSIDGDIDDCDRNFNIYIKNNRKAQLILKQVMFENPEIPLCADTTNIHVEVICYTGGCSQLCQGMKYDKPKLPEVGDSVSVTGKLIMDINGRCQFEIHPCHSIVNHGKSKTPLPVNCCVYQPQNCDSLRSQCPRK